MMIFNLLSKHSQRYLLWFATIASFFTPPLVLSQDVQTVVDCVNTTQTQMEEKIKSYTCFATNISQKLKKSGEIKSSDTTYFMIACENDQQQWTPVDKEGQSLSRNEKEKDEQKKDEKQASKANFSPFDCFSPEQRENYDFQLLGYEDEGTTLKLQIIPLQEDDKLIYGTVWANTADYVIRRMSFGPAKNPKFVKSLQMEIDFAPVQEGIWLPKSVKVDGRGKVLLFKFHFRSEQFYRDYEVVLNNSE